MIYEAECPECGKTIEIDEFDYQDSCEKAHDEERDSKPFYCVDCNLSFNE